MLHSYVSIPHHLAPRGHYPGYIVLLPLLPDLVHIQIEGFNHFVHTEIGDVFGMPLRTIIHVSTGVNAFHTFIITVLY